MTHDYKCKVCGKTAKINYQLTWISWNIGKDGKFTDEEFHNCAENEFYCNEHWNKMMNEID